MTTAAAKLRRSREAGLNPQKSDLGISFAKKHWLAIGVEPQPPKTTSAQNKRAARLRCRSSRRLCRRSECGRLLAQTRAWRLPGSRYSAPRSEASVHVGANR